MRQEKNSIVFLLCLAIFFGLSGCNKDQQQTQQSSIEWNGIDIVVIAVDQFLPFEKQGGVQRTPTQIGGVQRTPIAILETLYYMLNGSVVQELKTAIEKTTTPQGSRIQYIGSNVLIYAFEKNGDPSHYLGIRPQGVKGMGDKRNRNLDKSIFKSQDENRYSIIELVKANGKQVSEEQAQNYIQKARNSEMKVYTRYWKKYENLK